MMKELLGLAIMVAMGGGIFYTVDQRHKQRESEAIASLRHAARICQLERDHMLSSKLCSQRVGDALAKAEIVFGTDRAMVEARKVGAAPNQLD